MRTSTRRSRHSDVLSGGSSLHGEGSPFFLEATMAKARLVNKREMQTWQYGMWPRYLVDVICSECGHTETLAFGGWTATKCFGCGVMMERTPYRKASILEQLGAIELREEEP